MKYNNKYDDIINLPHHISKKHPRMSLYARSSQFAPFAALTGYEDAINETSRQTSKKIDIDEELKNILDSKLQIIIEQIKDKPEVTITYFIEDLKKEGGKYVTITGFVRKVDLYDQYIYFVDDKKIPINDIIDISSKLFKRYYLT